MVARKHGCRRFARFLPPGFAVLLAITTPSTIRAQEQNAEVLQGQAFLLNALGNFILQVEQARIVREEANQAMLASKKAALDWRNYERANTPTFTEEQQIDQALWLRRMMNHPIEAEIVHGQVQNAMLPLLAGLKSQRGDRPQTELDPDMLQQIDVTIGRAAGVGLLKAGGVVLWPIVVRGTNQKQVAALLPRVVRQTAQGELDPGIYEEVRGGLTRIHDDLRGRFRRGEIDGGAFLTGKRFLESLQKSVNSLQEPGAARQFRTECAAVGRTVPELVEHMLSRGLRFASCAPGNEQAYHALYHAMMTYANGAQNDLPSRRVADARSNPSAP